MASIKKNFFYSAFLTSANYIFPLLTLPYLTRVLGVTNYGLCSFIDSVVNYFILFSTMGIAIVGIREIASAKNDTEKLNRTFKDLFVVNALFTVAAIVVLIAATFLVPKLYEERELMFFGAFKVAFNFLLIEWFYKGIEDFRFITVRTLLVKCLYVAAIFIFVRSSDDYAVYYLLSMLVIAVNAIINITYSRKWISFTLRGVELRRFLRPLITYGVYAILTSFYTTFNVVYLGFATSDEQVGYYTVATRLYAIFISMVTAFTGVMMPRMSSLLSEGRKEEFRKMYGNSVQVLCSVTLPTVIFTIIMAPQIVTLLAGPDYGEAVRPMRVVLPLMFIIGYEQIMIVQALMPLRRDNVVLRNSIIGALAGVALNVILVGKLEAVGSAIVWLSCEVLILLLSQMAIRRVLGEEFPLRSVGVNLAVYAPLLLLWPLRGVLHSGSFISLLVCGLITLGYFTVVQCKVFPETLCGSYLLKLFRKVGI